MVQFKDDKHAPLYNSTVLNYEVDGFTNLPKVYVAGADQPNIDPVSMNRWCHESASPGREGDCWP
jgi:hypothetical protein